MKITSKALFTLVAAR